MTRLTYWAAQNKHRNYKGSIEGTPVPTIEFLWTEIVPGGEEELNKRKEAIIAEHKLWTDKAVVCDFFGKELGPIRDVQFLKEVRDYQEFEI